MLYFNIARVSYDAVFIVMITYDVFQYRHDYS